MTDNMPDWFCVIHKRALKSLTSEWQPIKVLPESFVAYENLAEAGLADRWIEQLTIGGIAKGSHHHYRLSE